MRNVTAVRALCVLVFLTASRSALAEGKASPRPSMSRAAQTDEPVLDRPDWVLHRFDPCGRWPCGLAAELAPTLIVASVGWNLEGTSAPASAFSRPWQPDDRQGHVYRSEPGNTSNLTVLAGTAGLVGAQFLTTSLGAGWDNWRIGAMDALVAAEAIGWTFFATQLIKTTAWRCRPAAYSTATDRCERDASNRDGEFEGSDAVRSFPSGHTAPVAAASGAYLASALRSHQYLSAPALVRWGAFAIGEALAVWTAYLRIQAGAHSLSDVAGGFLLGNAVGALVSLAHPMTRVAEPNDNSGAAPFGVSVGVMERQLVVWAGF